MNSPAQSVLQSLDRVRALGPDRWMARCPAHADNMPSLSIRDTGERVLLHCFAGCPPEAVLKAIGISFRDLYPDRWRAAQERAYAEKMVLPPIDLRDHAHNVLVLAAGQRAAGYELSLEDRAYVNLALERLGLLEKGVKR